MADIIISKAILDAYNKREFEEYTWTVKSISEITQSDADSVFGKRTLLTYRPHITVKKFIKICSFFDHYWIYSTWNNETLCYDSDSDKFYIWSQGDFFEVLNIGSERNTISIKIVDRPYSKTEDYCHYRDSIEVIL